MDMVVKNSMVIVTFFICGKGECIDSDRGHGNDGHGDHVDDGDDGDDAANLSGWSRWSPLFSVSGHRRAPFPHLQ